MEKRIYNDRPDIKKRVYETYPVTSKEKRCAIEKSKNEAKRFELAKRLYEEVLNNEYETMITK